MSSVPTSNGPMSAQPPWQPADDVRISRVRTILTAPEGVTLVVVKIETTEPGLYGLGCATFTQRALAVASAVDEYLAPQLVGRSPADITDVWHSLAVSGYWRNGPVVNNALSGVDMALWDILGKRAGMPVWQLLGGRCRSSVPVYAHATGRDPSETLDQVRALMADGYRHVRCQVAVPGATTYGTPHGATGDGAWDPAGYLRTVPALFERLRGELGDEVELLHDVHERLAPVDAIRLAVELEPYRLFFLEDLLAPEDLDWLRQVRSRSTTPLAIGELFVHPAEYLPLVSDRLCDFVRCHVSAIGGITPARRLAATAELFGVRTAWHGPGDVSPVGHAANLALDVACPNFGIQEQHPFGEAAREVFPGCPEVTGGRWIPSQSPGLGVDLDERLAAAHPPVDPLVNDAWTRTRLSDGTVARP